MDPSRVMKASAVMKEDEKASQVGHVGQSWCWLAVTSCALMAAAGLGGKREREGYKVRSLRTGRLRNTIHSSTSVAENHWNQRLISSTKKLPKLPAKVHNKLTNKQEETNKEQWCQAESLLQQCSQWACACLKARALSKQVAAPTSSEISVQMRLLLWDIRISPTRSWALSRTKLNSILFKISFSLFTFI